MKGKVMITPFTTLVLYCIHYDIPSDRQQDKNLRFTHRLTQIVHECARDD